MKKYLPHFIFLLAFLTGQLHAQVTKTLNGIVRYEHAQNVNRPNVKTCGGLEVNSYTGGLFHQRTDINIPGIGQSIDLTFYYNSFNTELDFGYGRGWSMTYSMLCIPDGDNMLVRYEDGQKDLFTHSGPVVTLPAGYTSLAGIFDSLVKYQPGKFRLTDKTGNKYFFDDSTHHRLTSIVDRNGNAMTISYTDSLPTLITDPSGRSVQLHYTSGHLTDITDPNTVPTRHVTFSNDASGEPVTVTDALGYTIQYQYDSVQNMTRRTDQDSYPFDIYYADCIHVTSVVSPLNAFSFSYDTTMLTTTVTEPVNSINQTTTYKYDSLGNLIEKNGSCCGYHQSYQYDSMKNMIQKTDANGNIWHYTHDGKGNLLQETDPLLNVTTYTYEPVHNEITSVTDKRGNTTTYIHDANGNLTQVNRPLGVVESYTYSGSGQIMTFTDGRGNTTTYHYNANGDKIGSDYPDGSTAQWGLYDNAGNMGSFIDPNGHTTTFTHNLLNERTSVVDALGHVNTYSYDGRRNNTSITDALGRATSTTYDALNRRSSVTTPKGTSSGTYDEYGNVLTTTDPLGHVTHYSYNIQNLKAIETDALGHSRSYGYDANGNRTIETDFNGNITTYLYDGLSRKIQVTGALSNVTVYAYDANNNRVSVTDANGHTTTYVYDALNRNTQMQRPIGTTTYAYDANGNKTSTVNANGNTITYAYDALNRMTTAVDPLTHTVSFTYDAFGNKLTTTDRNSLVTTYTYDAINRQVTETNAAGETKSFTYDALGNKISETLPGGNTISLAYDAGDREISVTDLTGAGRAATYDGVDNLLTQTDGVGHTVTYAYDVLNRRISAQDARGISSIFTYDNNSNLASVIDRNGHVTTFSYDALNRKITTVQPSGKVISNTYDAVGNTITLTDDRGNTTSYVYDANDRRITETLANGSSKSYTYDPVGNKISRTDNNGATTTLNYDAVNRLTSRDYPGTNDDAISYDAGGRVVTAVNSNAAVQYTYDNANRKLSENLNGHIISYNYNIPGRTITMTYPGGRVIEEDYDLRTRMSGVKDGGAPLAGFNYDAANRMLSRTYANNTITNFTYNNDDWVTSVDHSRSGIPFAHFNYTFDNEGNRLTAEKTHRPTNSEQYAYDPDYRNTNYKEGTLIGGNIPAPLTQFNWTYDGAGNRTTMVHDATTTNYNSNSVNQYVVLADTLITTPNYDADGNMVFDGTHNYQFDYENRILAVDGGGTATYKYDALGRRIQKISLSGTINYYYDGHKVIEERDAANAVTNTYVYGLKLDEILSIKRLGVNFFYHHNSLGSVVAVTNNTGVVVERYEYNAFGSVTFYNPAFTKIPATAIGNRILFNSREYDSETKTYYYRARNYNPLHGRFMQRDPLEYIDGVNIYEYCLSNPENKIDPLGLASCPPKELGCVETHDKLTFIDIKDFPLGSLGPFIIKGSVKVTGELDTKTCLHCCPDCTIRPWGNVTVTVTADVGVSMTAGWKIFELEIYGKLHAVGKGTLDYDLCIKPKGKLCVDLTGSLTIGVKASASVVIATVYAGAEATGTCTFKVCVDETLTFDVSTPTCSLSGRIYVGVSTWFGSKEWDLWASK